VWILLNKSRLNLAVVTAYCVLDLISDLTKYFLLVGVNLLFHMVCNWTSDIYTSINAFWDMVPCRSCVMFRRNISPPFLVWKNPRVRNQREQVTADYNHLLTLVPRSRILLP
jgi:hypothetical protein